MKLRTIKKLDKKIIKQNEVHLRAIASVGILPENIIADFAKRYCGMQKVESDKLLKEEQERFKRLKSHKSTNNN